MALETPSKRVRPLSNDSNSATELANDVHVSVVMAAYNAETFLLETLRAVLSQSCDDMEVVVVDDGSTDGTPRILREFMSGDKRLHVITQPNRGLTSALNVGWRAARGKFIARIDADDIMLPHRLSQQAAFLEEHPECVAVGCQMIFVDEDGDPVLRHDLPTNHEEIDDQLMRGVAGVIPHPGAMLRRSALEAVGGYREAFTVAQDYDLWLRLAEIGRLANLSTVLLHYRTRLNNITARNHALQTEFVQIGLADARQRRGLPTSEQAVAESDHLSPQDLRLRWVIQAANNGFHRTARKQLRKLLSEGGGIGRTLRGLAYVICPVPKLAGRSFAASARRTLLAGTRRIILTLADAAGRCEARIGSHKHKEDL